MENIIIGTGTGRCGTKSLAKLLNSQPCSFVTHEMYKSAVPYLVDSVYSKMLIKDLRVKIKLDYTLVGDVALQWLWYANELLKVRNLKMIYMDRDFQETIDSYYRKLGKYNFDHWSVNPEIPSNWDAAYPKYLEFGLKQFVGHCKATAHYLEKTHPGRFIIFKMNDLNDPEKQVELFQWIGLKSYKILTNIHENRTI